MACLFVSFLLIAVMIAFMINTRKKSKYNIDGKTWKEFEKFCSSTLTRNGYKIIKEYSINERKGVDIFAEKSGKTYAIQCKSYKNPVRNNSVVEASAGKEYCGADVAVIMTNSMFDNKTIFLARKYGVFLWDGNKIKSMLLSADKKEKRKKKERDKQKEVKYLSKWNGKKYMSGCYIVGDDIEKGTYIIKPLEQDDTATVEIYENYNDMLISENKKFILVENPYRIPLKKDGIVIEINDGTMEKEK